VATGLNRMHTLGLVHMDIKPENILITEQGVLKIGDLGMAQYVNTDEDGLEGDARYVKSCTGWWHSWCTFQYHTLKMHARITLTVECIRTCIFFDV
jgi:serine/threonine protein kinase